MALVVKNLPASAGGIRDVGLITRLGRSPGGGHGYPLRYSCLENRGAWWSTVHRVAKSQTWLKPHTHRHIICSWRTFDEWLSDLQWIYINLGGRVRLSMTQTVSKLHQSLWNPSPSRVLKIGQFLCCLHCCRVLYLCWWMISKLSLHRLLPPWARGSAPLILRYLDSFVLVIHLFEKYRSIFTFHFIVYLNSLLFVCLFFILDWKILKGTPPSLYLSPFSLCLILAHMRCLLKAWKVKLTWALNSAEQA